MSNEPDIILVQSLILAGISEGNDVVLLGHSSGGVISTSAVRGLVPSKHRGKVLGLIFIASFLVPTDSSIIGFIKFLPPPKTPIEHWSSPDVTRQWSTLMDPHPTGIVQRFYHDLPPEDAMQHVGMLQKKGADMQVSEIEASHTPFLSKTLEVVRFVEEAVAAFQA